MRLWDCSLGELQACPGSTIIEMHFIWSLVIKLYTSDSLTAIWHRLVRRGRAVWQEVCKSSSVRRLLFFFYCFCLLDKIE